MLPPAPHPPPITRRVLLPHTGCRVFVQSPVDVLPEVVLGIFGYIDDVIAFVVLLLFLTAVYRRRVLARQQRVSQCVFVQVCVCVCERVMCRCVCVRCVCASE